jgi:FkbM family methyltransferase
MIVNNILNGSRLVAVDVGAANGLPETWQMLRDSSVFFYLIEPNPDSCASLPRYFKPEEAGTYKIIPVAVSGTGGTRKLYVSNASTGSSLLSPNTRLAKEYVLPEYLFPMKILQVETRTLADIFDEVGEQQLDFFKLDTQGTELEILQGLGSDRMNQVLGVELEIGMPGGYRNQGQFSDVQKFMVEHGLELFDLRLSRAHRPYQNDRSYYPREIFKVIEDSPSIARRIWEVDALFFREPNSLIDARDSAAIRRLIVLYCSYRFFTEAYSLVEKGQTAKLFDAEHTAVLRTAILNWHHVIKQNIDKGMKLSWLRHG